MAIKKRATIARSSHCLTLTGLDVMQVAEGGEQHVGGALCPGHVTGLVGVPLRLAVVAEVAAAPRPLALQLGAAGTPRGHHRIAAVRRGAPARVRVGGEDTSQHEVLKLEGEKCVVDNGVNV